MIKECSCGFNTTQEWHFCPVCGNELSTPEEQYVPINSIPIDDSEFCLLQVNCETRHCSCGSKVFKKINKGHFVCIVCKNEIKFDMIKTMIKNPDENLVFAIEKRLKINGGYCPCVPQRNEDTKCPCKKFREDQECCCNLYIEKPEEIVENKEPEDRCMSCQYTRYTCTEEQRELYGCGNSCEGCSDTRETCDRETRLKYGCEREESGEQ